MDFSAIADACEIGRACRFDAPKYTPANARTAAATTPPTSSAFLFDFLAGAPIILVGLAVSCSRCATSGADCGRRGGAFSRQAATTSFQTRENKAGSASNTFLRPVI